MNIPNAAVEAAARVIGDWDGLPNRPEAWQHDARVVLVAAAPHLIEATESAVREQVAQDIEEARSQAPAWVAESHLSTWQAALAYAARIASGEA